MLFELTVTNLAHKTHLSAYDSIGFIAKYYQLLNASSYKGYCSKIRQLAKKKVALRLLKKLVNLVETSIIEEYVLE